MSNESTLEKAFGIDLGTTYSAIAHINPNTGQPEIIQNTLDNSNTTASVVFAESVDNHVVGKSAKQRSLQEPEKVVDFVKRLMGKQEVAREIDGKSYRPEEISAIILKQLVADAENATAGPVKKVVITCPAYFGLKERLATQVAGELAGLEVLQIIEEPIAAALSYDINLEETKTVLVYDLGGGTFDVTLIKFTKGEPPEVIAADGADTLGGKDWDDRLIEYFVKEFKVQCCDASDITDDMHVMQELRNRAEETKIALSRSKSRPVPIRFNGNNATIEVTQEIFDDITKDLLANTEMPLDRLLKEAAPLKGVTDFDELILVGGSTLMPQVRRMLEAKFPGKPIRLHKPNEAVAMGAAKLANDIALIEWAKHASGMSKGGAATPAGGSASDEPMPVPTKEQMETLEAKAAEQGLNIQMIKGLGKRGNQAPKPVSPKSYGVLAWSTKSVIRAYYDNEGMTSSFESDHPRLDDADVARVTNIIWKNDTIWDGHKVYLEVFRDTFGTGCDNQDELAIEVFQSEELPTDNNKKFGISETVAEQISSEPLRINLPPGQKQGTRVKVIFSLNREGMLTVEGECAGVRGKTEIKVLNAISKEEKEELVKQMAKITTTN